jgi:hypothetical protein
VVAAAGRRIDADDAAVRRFPLDGIDTTRRRIRDILLGQQAVALVSSAACGADLLALSAAAELRLRRRVVLPFEAEQFRTSSVTDRPGDWAPMFDETLRQIRATGDLVVLEEAPGDHAYALASEAVLDEAEAIARENGDRRVAMIIWDGQQRDGVDLTMQFRGSAKRRGFEIVDVLTSDGHG